MIFVALFNSGCELAGSMLVLVGTQGVNIMGIFWVVPVVPPVTARGHHPSHLSSIDFSEF